MAWENAERVQKNDKGEYRALIGGEWVPVSKAQKNAQGQYRIERAAPVASQQEELPSTGTLTNIIGGAVEPNLSLLSGAISGPLSGYAGMLGAALPGPEGQGAEWTRSLQNALTYKPITEGGQAATKVIGYPFEKLAQGADWAGQQAANVTGSPAVGAAVNAGLQVGVPMAASRLLRQPPAAETGQGRIAQSLMQKAVKPDRADLLTGDAQKAFRTMLDEGIMPSPGGMTKAQEIARAMDRNVEAGIAGSNATVNIPRAASPLRDVMKRAQEQTNNTADVQAVRNAWNEFHAGPDSLVRGRVDIPVQLAHTLKKGTYRALGGKAYGEVGSTSTEAQKALARGLRQETLAAVPEVRADLAREAALRNVLDVVEKKALMTGNNNPQGLAALRMDNPLSWGSFMFDRSAQAKAALARALYATGDPNAVRTAMGLMAVQAGSPQEAR